MEFRAIDLAELLHPRPPGAWVAISERQGVVVFHGADLEEALRDATTREEDQPLLMRAPDEDTPLFLQVRT